MRSVSFLLSFIGAFIFLMITNYNPIWIFVLIVLGFSFAFSIKSNVDERKRIISKKEIKIVKKEEVKKYANCLDEGEAQIHELMNEKKSIKNVEIQERIVRICDVSQKIIDHVRTDEKDMKKAKNFVEYYLIPTVVILRKYNDLSQFHSRTPELDNILKRAEDLFNKIYLAFENLFSRFLENNMMDFDVDMKTLEKIINTSR